MAALSTDSPRARLYVVSIPNVYRLWALFKDDALARLAWRTLDVCQSLFEDPRSTDADDVARRRVVRDRVVAFNGVLAEVCATYIHCRFDDDVVFNDRFTADEVSPRDYFHPSRSGQRRLAEVSWAATFDFTDGVPPVSTATVTPSDGGAFVALEAMDDVGVAGIEYRVDFGLWQRYAATLALATGTNLRFRAVDVNGNTEETHVLTV